MKGKSVRKVVSVGESLGITIPPHQGFELGDFVFLDIAGGEIRIKKVLE